MIFDRAHLNQYTAGDAALEAELVGLLRDQAERCLGAMQAATDINAWRAAAHTLKGASRGVGAFELGEACQRAEDAPQAAWPMAVIEVRRAADAAFAEIDSVLAA
ncbi:Hpt domain-containing protein [Hyphobacterium sp. CCMP332]|jgi:HPt (histidine-containing phosphotransfer) domain-containing protein|uniref:Hpt domain-containing protein n=1 Tax=Hyphobacterium sp. CCMP332 TaxID=2749086 RepID=UPI00164FD0D2|nr:Hpt domain-containing protein [Hyphobacterium sp. CCMP332]QNL18324.1 Hpt domain-containing protein [Hyphobacterium sp. CCMP332]